MLYHCDGEFVIRVGGLDLMSSHAHVSEEELARLTLEPMEKKEKPRVLIGGLGLGYTARAALDMLPPQAELVVAEIVPAVIRWNRGPLAHLANHPLDDPRVTLQEIDVRTLLVRATQRFDAILLDVDNGPAAFTRKPNQTLYSSNSLEMIQRTLRPGGALAVWSATSDDAFSDRLRDVGFTSEMHSVNARGRAGGPRHTIFIGRI